MISSFRRDLMPHFMLEVAYTPNAWANQLSNPQDRIAAIRPVIERLGGKLEQAWYTFGDYDIMCIFSMPDNIGATAFSLAVTAGGACKKVKTTPLMDTADAMEAMK